MAAKRDEAIKAMAALAATLTLLSGCMGGTTGVSRANSAPGSALAPAGQEAGQSAIISALMQRRSVLPAGGALAQTADAVLASYAGAEETQLRVARLRAEARATNWIPRIGPSVSLTSLSGFAAGLSIEHGLMDNGRRKAERDFAAADVDVAAVNLVAEVNNRVYDGLAAQVRAAQAEAMAAVSRQAAGKLAEFEDIMAQRVEGGISDRSEQSIIAQRLTEMQATVSGDDQAAANARAALAALVHGGQMAAGGGLELASLGADLATVEALSVLKAKGEGNRAIAEATAGRAGLLPGLNGSVSVTTRGIDPGIRLGGAYGAGTRAELDALAQTPELVDQRNAAAAEQAERRRVTLENQIAVLQTRQGQGAEVLRQTEGNLGLFTEQYRLGRRSLLELVGQYDSFARLKRDQVSIGYEITLLRLELARDRGLLVDGSRL